ncbi:MAG: hypothetical protein LBE72_03045, partial [Rickettsia sp.]|nr:hypothetical protein [Rickettsia sp.]
MGLLDKVKKGLNEFDKVMDNSDKIRERQEKQLEKRESENQVKLNKIDHELEMKINEYINTDSSYKKGSLENKVRKISKKKLKNEMDLCDSHKKMLEDLPCFFVGSLATKNFKPVCYPDDLLKLVHLSKEEYKNKVIELSTTEGISVLLPKIEQQISNDAGTGAIGGGLLFGTTGAVIGGALGASQQNITEQFNPGETANLKIAKKGIVITTH